MIISGRLKKEEKNKRERKERKKGMCQKDPVVPLPKSAISKQCLPRSATAASIGDA